MNIKDIYKNFWFWALVWYAISVLASAVTYDVITEPMGDIATYNIYHGPTMFLFFPTLITFFILGEPAARSLDIMLFNHLVAIPLYLLFSYLVALIINKLKNK